jgi:FkbM family methyltransferase
MIELGCYWSYYSLWFHKAAEGARNFMIEPNKTALQCGIKNFQFNRMIGDFTQAFVGKTSSEGWQQPGAGRENATVGRVCVKDFAQSKGIKEVALLHSDIQGYEYEMLCGCGDLLDERKIGFFFISTHSLKVHFQCLKHLAKRGYIILAEHVPKEGYAEDGLIVASSVRSCQEPIEVSKKPVSLRQHFKAAYFRAFA